MAALLGRSAADHWQFPRSAGGVSHLVWYAGTRGLGARAALAGTGLATGDLGAVGVELTAAQELRVVRNLVTRVGADAAAGAGLGRTYRLSTYGIFGYAVLSSPTVLDAIRLALRFFDLSHAFVAPTAALEGERVEVGLDAADLPADVRTFLLHRDAEGIRTALRELLPGAARVELTADGDDRVRLAFRAAYLDRVLPAAAVGDAELCEGLCHDLVDRRRARHGVARDARVVITQRLRTGAPMAAVAAGLGLSERSLRRHLATAGTSYRALLDEVRSSLAGALLDTGLGVAEVAGRLGYAEAASFIHAHRRWTGTTPGRVRST
ncbi:AraC family transcriptional regulator [Nocardioides sp. SYSU D00038]|uniref:helix-turn-helix domain-containing protein n=1 Tax=Nocardioides sp. SYSU D00038 TaxID=2812554 RepID=UPI001967F1E1|nr:AraC family transcriptional regulator ligand-binding domain-containing protein [Nocardioides sp. SYSU D00038]